MAHSPKRKRREATWEEEPKCFPAPIILEPPPSDAKAQFVWKVNDAYIDYDFDELGWCNCKTVQELLNDVIKELQAHESLTWQEVREKSPHNHSWNYEKLPIKLRNRLDKRGLFLPKLFQIILGNKPRIWGYKNLGIFYLMWYDPKHKGCKVKVK